MKETLQKIALLLSYIDKPLLTQTEQQIADALVQANFLTYDGKKHYYERVI
jgi:hypothetical protein